MTRLRGSQNHSNIEPSQLVGFLAHYVAPLVFKVPFSFNTE